MGLAPKITGATETAAQTHALLRANSGFDIRQLAAEYRALRASVLSRWMDACQAEAPHLDDIIRFNEAIDQALAESVDFFSTQVEQARDLLLGMLGHDLRTPLQSIQMTAHYLAALRAGDKVSEAAGRLINSGARMKALLDDLIYFIGTRSAWAARMHRISAGRRRRVDDRVDAQITLARRARTDGPRFIRQPHVQRGAIAFGVHGDGGDAHVPARANHAHGNLAAIGDQDLLHQTEPLTILSVRGDSAPCGQRGRLEAERGQSGDGAQLSA